MFGIDDQETAMSPTVLVVKEPTAGLMNVESSSIGWIELLRSLKERKQITNEELGLCLGLGRSMVSQILRKDRPLPAPARIRLLCQLGYPVSLELLLSTVPDEVRQAFLECQSL